MNLKLAVFGVVIASLLFADQAQAQTLGNKLRGINQISLLIEQLDDATKACQITDALIQSAFMYPASGARFVVVKTSINVPNMYFNIVTVRPNQICVSNIDMLLYVDQEVKLKASNRDIYAVIQLWTGGSIRSSANGQHAQAVRDTIERVTKKFITDWNLDNK